MEREKYWRTTYTTKELETLIREEPITKEGLYSLWERFNLLIRFFPWEKPGGQDGLSSFEGIKNGRPDYLIDVNTHERTEELQKESLIHELIHIYYRVGGGIFSNKEGNEPLIQRETLKVIEQHPYFVDWIFRYCKNSKNQPTN